MTDELVNLTIDGFPVSVPKGTTIIEAAKQAGVLVPHYCYHPSLSAPAVCRMCLVEVEKSPKLQPACVTAVAEGQVVRVNSAPAKKAREGVLEFLLINHPLDCPICDQAGECELQDFVFQEGRPSTRYSEFAKRYNPVEDFGPDVLYVANRCILCTRCVRFMEEMAQEPVLNVSERGDRAFIGISPEQQLDHAWAGNVVDLCPVGSLISKDFLHRARAWELDKTASVCPGCTQGCNVTVETRDNAVVRLRPRPNMEVNRHFMCDYGRLNYRWLNRGDRLEAPLVRDPEAGDGAFRATDWDAALARLRALVRGGSGPAVILASGGASLESLGLVRRMLDGYDVTAAIQVPVGEEAPLPGVPNLALRAERVPNLDGALLLGYGLDWQGAVDAARRAGLVVVLDVILEPEEEAALAGSAVVVLGTVATEQERFAELVLPVTNMAEENGTFVNRDLRLQRYNQAKAPPGMARPAWWVAAEAMDLGRGAPSGAGEAFELLAESVPALAGTSYADVGFTGLSLAPAVAGLAGRAAEEVAR